MKFIKLTKKNVESIDCNEVAFYSFAETGAMGVHAGIEIITFDNKKYAGTYAFGDLNITNFYRALPSLKRSDSGKSFEHMYLGMGNNLYVRKEILDDFVKILNKDIPDYEKNRGEFYKGWRICADKLLTDYDKPEVKEIKPIKEDRLNPFGCMGFDIDINDRKTQEKIIRYAEKNAIHNIDAYSYKLYNAYSSKKSGDGIQFAFKRNNREMTLTEKMDDLVIHHTNSISWDVEVDQSLANEDEFFIKPFVSNARGMALVKVINADIEPYIEVGDRLIVQPNCFAYDMRVFKGDERFKFGENNFQFIREDTNGPIYLSDNNILMAAIFYNDEKYKKLNFVRGDVICIESYTSTLFGQKREYKRLYVDTNFGPTPIIFNEKDIKYMNGDKIHVGDRIEALCSINVDKMLYYERVKDTLRDKTTYFDVVKKAFELKNMSYLENILSEDCEYHSDEHDYLGKKTVLEKLQYITNEGYGDKEIKLRYASIIENPIKHFPLGEEVLSLCHEEDGSVEAEINIHVNKNKLIDKIYLTNSPKIRFRMYNDDGSLYLDEEEQKVFKKLIKKLETKGLNAEQVRTVLGKILDDILNAKELLEYVSSKKKNKNIFEEIKKRADEIFEKYCDKHPHRLMKIIARIQSDEKKEYTPTLMESSLD